MNQHNGDDAPQDHDARSQEPNDYTVKHNYILPISTVRIKLHVSVLYVDHLQIKILTYRLVMKDVWCIWVGGGPQHCTLYTVQNTVRVINKILFY